MLTGCFDTCLVMFSDFRAALNHLRHLLIKLDAADAGLRQHVLQQTQLCTVW